MSKAFVSLQIVGSENTHSQLLEAQLSSFFLLSSIRCTQSMIQEPVFAAGLKCTSILLLAISDQNLVKCEGFDPFNVSHGILCTTRGNQ